MRRWWILLAAAAVVAAACGEDGSGLTVPDTAPASTAAPVTSAAPATTAPGAAPAAAGAASTGSMVLLADDFEDGDAEGWEIDSGWYLLGTGSAFAMAASGASWAWWPGGEAWHLPYALRCSFRFDAGGLAVSLAVGEEGRYVVHLHEDGTDLLLERPWGTFTTLGSGEAVEPGAWHLLAAGADADRIQVYVDGDPWAAASIPDPLPGGSVGFGAMDGSLAAFDNVYVSVLTGGLPPFPAGLEEPAEPAEPAEAPPVVAAPPGEDPDPPEDDGGAFPAPDLRVRSVSFDAGEYLAGQSVGVDIRVLNEGTAASGPCEAAWEAMGSSCSAEVPALDPGAEVRVSCTAPPLPPGLHTWTVHADHDGRVGESDEGNNGFSGIIEVHVTASAVVDLAVGPARSERAEANQEFFFEVEVVDLNSTGFAGLFTMRLTVDGALVCSRDMAVGSTASCRVPGLPAGAHVFEAVVDPDNEIAEERKDNNRKVFEVVVAPG